MSEPNPTFFPAPADFRAWLEEHHATTDHLWVGYYKKATNKPSVTWEDTVEEALCYGWIDGIPEVSRRREFHDSLHTSGTEERLEPKEHRSCRTAHRGRPNES